MFTGIIEEIGSIVSIERYQKALRLGIKGNCVFEDIKIGCSIAVNGVCLTITSWKNNVFYADVMLETVKSSSLGNLHIGAKVNLERAMLANGRFDGHIVSGHVDGLAILIKKEKQSTSIVFTFSTTEEILQYIVYKGSITINGISLTVSKVDQKSFSVSLIPHSLQKTTMQYLKIQDSVNIETDILAKYIKKFTSQIGNSADRQQPPRKNIDEDFLRKNGFL